MELKINKSILSFVEGDITEQETLRFMKNPRKRLYYKVKH